MQSTYLFGFATFGHPNDYRQSPFKFDKEDIAKNVPIFDLTNAIKIFPGSTLYAIRKVVVNGNPGISYAIYTYAKEMNSSREGTFIGSGILFTNEIAEESITIAKLNEFHSILVKTNTANQTLTVNHSKDFTHSEKFLTDFEKIAQHLKPIQEPENFNATDKHIVILTHTDPKTLDGHFKKSLELLNKYDTVFFTDSRDITGYCRDRKIYTVTDGAGFDEEIKNIKDERKQQLLKAVVLFEQEKGKLKKDNDAVLVELNKQLSTIETIHAENVANLVEAKSAVEKVNIFYGEFSGIVDDYIQQIQSGTRVEKVKDLYNENKKLFIKSIADLKQPKYVKKIPKIKTGSKLPLTGITLGTANAGYTIPDQKKEYPQRHRKLNRYKIASFLLSLLWISTILFFVLTKPKSTANNQDLAIVHQPDSIKQDVLPIKLVELNPIPNTTLNNRDLKILQKEGLKGKKASQVVDIIFAKNPTDIASYYKDQKEVYAQVLMSKNVNCFVGDSCVNDSLVVVMGFRKE